ncbi:hypothetical protein [Pseudonocardia alaniniphila]|uniref:Uncharacterized protein n=1 Tax=Pseudonocardia alaniniphila TaxID=75291 RepID=A0ABS9THL9_9PSEU|nr:hypothetical protein [Pseudonocardia alaniniphila]MCH6167908.1 hypothetical protein [Pseudonocardia alaniniphila]
MARFRLFGRAPTPASPSPAPPGPGAWPYGPPGPYGPPPPWGAAGPPPVGAGAPWPAQVAGPATRAARPLPPQGAVPPADPPTDPVGFPPIPAVPAPRPPAPQPPGWWGQAAPPPPGPPTPHPAEAAALAGAFAVDYLSWDEEDPQRRGRVLQDYLASSGADPAHLGWSGHGRQRAEFALPGRVSPDGEGRVLVDVRVRVTPYRCVGEREADRATGTGPEPGSTVGTPASAPAPTGRGWRGLPSSWIRLSVAVVSEGGRLVVDAGEETLGEEPEPQPPPAIAADDHTLADDDPLSEPRAAGAW